MLEACLFPGSFDPVTNGHLDIIRRAAALFEKVYVGVLYNPDKQGTFTPEERAELIRLSCADLPNVEVYVSGGLTVDLLKDLGVRVAVRGVRSAADLESESLMARVNRQLYPEMETLFLPASAAQQDVSSSIVRQIASFGGDVSMFVPSPVAEAVRRKFNL